MKLSEAINKGADQTAHGVGKAIFQIEGKVYTNALGAAAIAVEGLKKAQRNHPYQIVVKHWPFIEYRWIKVMEIAGEGFYLWGAIICLEEIYGWSREQISEWLIRQGL